MYVYLCTEKPGYLGSLGVWTVGHYDPSDNRWIGTADYGAEEEAADRVAFLNGGDTSKNLRRLEGVVRQLVGRVDMIDGHVTRSLALLGKMLQREALRAGINAQNSAAAAEVVEVLKELDAVEPKRTELLGLRTLDEHRAAADRDEDACTNPGGHEWDKSAGEADEARLAGDSANDGIHCIHCGADGDA